MKPVYLFAVMMIAFWGTTVIAYFGEGVSSKFQNYGAILGSIIPSILIIALGLYWMVSGAAIVLPPFTPDKMLPTINPATFPFFATVIFLFAGMDMAGFHALETRNPATDYPRAMAISAGIIFFCTVVATLAIALVIPASEISLAAWLIGPAKGLGVVAEQGNLPLLFSRTNKYGSPVAVLLVQALIGTLVSVLYIFMPSVNQAYWILTAITVELLCIVYFLVFASLIKIRYSRPDAPRPFKIPGGMPGIWVIGGMGAVGVVVASIAGLLPPATASPAGMVLYPASLLFGTFLLAVPPLIFLKLKKPGWEQGRKQGGISK